MKQLRKYESELREIEKVIDIYHKNLGIFKKPYQQATIDVLRTFETLANSTINIAAKLSSFDMANGPTRDLLDGLNMSMMWIFNQCNDKNTPFSIVFLESEFWKSLDLLNSYATPYATICDAYIAYSRGKFEVSEVQEIVQILTYNPELRHSDIIYQPIVKLGDFYVIAPSLITSSRPERNLISVIQKTNDKEYFKRVNELEGIMRQELVSALPQDQQLFLAHDIHLEDYLPDIDLTIYDEQ